MNFPFKLISFTLTNTTPILNTTGTTENSETLKTVVIERSADGSQFSSVQLYTCATGYSQHMSSSYQSGVYGNAILPDLCLQSQSGSGSAFSNDQTKY
jgi:hypothetical protein